MVNPANDPTPDSRRSAGDGPAPGRDAGGRFAPGTSGNPGGRARRDREIKRLLDVGAPLVLQAAIERATVGDTAAMKLVLDRGAPVPRAGGAEIGPQTLIAALVVIINGLPDGATRALLLGALSDAKVPDPLRKIAGP